MKAHQKMKLLSILVLVLLFPTMTFAQNVVKGIVKSTDGEPLIGVAVSLKSDAAKGVFTDLDGQFVIDVKDANEILLFSYIGFVKQERKAVLNATMNVVMEEESKFLDEVVVVGYQEIRRRDLTGSVAKADMGDLLET